MNPELDQMSCDMCRVCYRDNTLQCRDACRRCSVSMFSEDSVNVYPSPNSYPFSPNYLFNYPIHSPTPKSFGRIYYNYPRVSNQYYPSMFPYGNYYGSLYR